MHHGSTTKVRKKDDGWEFGEFYWLAHMWSKRGLQPRGPARGLRYYKRLRNRRYRLWLKRDLQERLKE